MSKYFKKHKVLLASLLILNMLMQQKLSLNHLQDLNAWCKITLNFYLIVIESVLQVFLKDIASRHLKMILLQPT